ncbi:hypothetical protein SAMN04487820_1119 [Actinopolyspora mzabensis]|uniref:PH domain-containing protein n=1 Tax=Actinopolyspora mzabensis TaxID=995066 RepID=A0A1G9DYA2_ACTMZ|nr:hypothetical protein SAMN04487820_1119 [Actinopolyspora mzabensis]
MFDLGKRLRRNALIGALVLGPFGLLVLFGSITNNVDGPAAARVFSGIFGAALLGVAVLIALLWPVISRTQQLVLEHTGIRWHDPRGRPFTIRWQELAEIVVHRKWTPSRFGRSSAQVRVELYPAGHDFRKRHPDLEHLLREGEGRPHYRLTLGPNKTAATIVDEGLQRFQPRLRQGIREENQPPSAR